MFPLDRMIVKRGWRGFGCVFQLDEQTDDKRSLSMTACHPLADVQEQSGIIGACSMENLACCCCIVVLMDMVPSAENMQDKRSTCLEPYWGRFLGRSIQVEDLSLSKDSIANMKRDMIQQYTHMTYQS